jgi:hypothetical protein
MGPPTQHRAAGATATLIATVWVELPPDSLERAVGSVPAPW